MKIMVVAPGPKFSTYDTFLYYGDAFSRLGHKVFKFNYHDHFAYHLSALSYLEGIEPEDVALQRRAMTIAGEDLISRIARTGPEFIFVVSGIALPPGVWDWLDTFRENLIRPFTTMVLFTESPYIDETQKIILNRTDIAATIDRSNLDAFRDINSESHYIRHAYNPRVHTIMPRSIDHGADVFMVGTGFPERIKLLSEVNWDGVDLRIFGGNWGDTKDSDAIEDFYTAEFLDNKSEVPLYYTNSRISLNIFRTAKMPGENVLHIPSDLAYSVSPRCYEIMGCGGFLLSDARQELLELFEEGKDFVMFDGAEDLQDKMRFYLHSPRSRDRIALSGFRAVSGHTYENRAKEIIDIVEEYWRAL